MILSKNSLISYNEIKHLTNQTKISDEDFLKMTEIYSEITGRPISKGCYNCIAQAWVILNNWADKFYYATVDRYAEVEKAPKNEIQEVKRRGRKKKTV